MKYTIDFCTSRQLLGTDLRTCSFNSLLQVLPKRCHHSAIIQKQCLILLQFQLLLFSCDYHYNHSYDHHHVISTQSVTTTNDNTQQCLLHESLGFPRGIIRTEIPILIDILLHGQQL